jgi:F-type H+-transporting ATPase subunit a
MAGSTNDFATVLTTYTPFIFLILILVLVVVFVAKKQLALVPRNRFVGAIEYFFDFTQDNVGRGVMGADAKKHVPFLATLFIYIILANLIGLIPGFKAATGVMGTTFALALISYIYYTVQGIKARGAWHYIKSIGPSGIKPWPLNAFIWVLELISNLLRLLTLAVRLFANMFAGHILLGTVSILATLFLMPLIQQISGGAFLMAGASLRWMVLLIVLYALELFMAVIQAYVFVMLSSVYIMLATQEH